MQGAAGFTLVELLMVIVIIAILACIAIPIFFGHREKADDTVAYTLVRNALTAVQGSYVDTCDYRLISADMLSEMEPSITWVTPGVDLVSVDPPALSDAIGAQASKHEVAFYAQSADVVDVASVSRSGNSFGIQVDTRDLLDTGYVKVRVIDGSVSVGW